MKFLANATLICLLSLAFGCHAGNEISDDECVSIVEGITEMPLKDDMPARGNYHDLLDSKGDGALSRCLLSQITNTDQIPDPRLNVPNRRKTVAVGDVAVFMLTSMYDVPYTSFVDPDQWENMGVFAYFDYVADNDSRKQIQTILAAELANKLN